MQKKIAQFLISLGIAILFNFPLFAASENEQMITLEDAYRSAIVRSESIAISREDLIQSEDEVRRIRSFLYPNITASFDYLRRPDEIKSSGFTVRSKSSSDFNLTLEQPLYRGGRAMARFRSAKLGRKGGWLQVQQTKEDLFFAIATAYYDTLKANNNVEIELKEVERLTEHRRSAEKQLEVGEVTKTVLFRAAAELSDAQAKLIRARNEALEAKDQLALLARIEGSFTLKDPAPVSISDRSEVEWISMAHENRIELKQDVIGIEKAKEEVKFSRGGFLPSLSLELQYRWADQDPESSFLVKNDRLALLTLEVPIFEGMLHASELAQARSRHRQSRLNKKRRQDEIATQVRRTRLTLLALTSELKHLKDRVRFAKEAFSLAERQFEVGLGTNIEVLDANATLLDAERQHINTIFDREVAILQIKKESGLFSPLKTEATPSP